MTAHEIQPFVKIDPSRRLPGKDFTPRSNMIPPEAAPKGLSAPLPVIDSQADSKSQETSPVQPEPSSSAESPEVPVSPDVSSDAKLSSETPMEKTGDAKRPAVTRPSRKQ